ncbi:restriction endonuclease subunit S [Aphanizomenon sp. CS-733/32]|uniref:restriction endonuclease subunit S n=1 Tax=Aphanizomenon sp. CS-733/32 TaxID=3021715 RepID=UPI003FA4B799
MVICRIEFENKNIMQSILLKISEIDLKDRLTVEHYICQDIKLIHKLRESVYPLVPLGQIATVKGGKRLPANAQYSITGIPYVRVVDVGDFEVDLSNVVYISEDLHNKIQRYQLQQNDIAIVIVGATIGKTAIFKSTVSPCNFNENLARITSKDNKFNPQYLLAYLKSCFGQAYITWLTGGSAQAKLSLERIEKINIPLPPKPIQDRIAQIMQDAYHIHREKIKTSQEMITNVEKIKVLKTELSIEPIRADSVILLQTKNRILHLEFQTRTKSETPIPLRMLDYFVRLVRQYHLPVTQVVIFLQETTNEIAFTEAYIDEMTTHRYRVIRMWEQDSDLFLNNPALLPLAPLTKTNSAPELLSQVAREIAKITDVPARQNTAAYTEILAGLRFEKNLIRQLLSEDIMQESVIYQDILQKGEQKGEQKEAFRFLNRLLNRRFGEMDSFIVERIRLLPTEQLEILGEEFLEFSGISDLVNWLDTHLPRSL